MSCFNEILKASATMADCTLEPTDDTTYYVKIKNVSDKYTANNVMANIRLMGDCLDGIRVEPDDRYFGTIPPGGCVTKEITILTERATKATYEICYHLNFTASFEECEGETTCFEVDCD